MHVSTDKNVGIITCTSASGAEERILKLIARTTAIGGKLKYSGRSGADCNDPMRKRMRLGFFLASGEKFFLVATTRKDELPIRFMRDAVYFGSGGLIFLGFSKPRDKFIVKLCIERCKKCSRPLVRMGECEWKMCKGCRDICDHQYELGPTHGGRSGVFGIGEFCVKCGRGNMASKPRIIIPHKASGVVYIRPQTAVETVV